MSHDDMSNSSGFNEAAAAFSWNGPKKAINPYLDPAEVAPESALLNLITLYAADNEQEQLRRDALSEQVWERYFFNESRDPVQREMEQDKLISRAKLAHEQQRFNPDMVILADVNAQPSHISKPLMQRIEYFSSQGRPKAYSRYLRETIKPCLERLEHVRDCQLSTSFRFMASHEGLDGLLILPEMSQDQVKRLSTLVAAHMSMCLDAACGDLYATDDVKPEEIRKTWEKVAAETLRLDVIPPAFEQLRRKRNRRKPVPYELIPGSLARMLCADWWYRKLWKMRCEWREEQLRAVCLVSKKASPYVSYEAVMHKREQRRKSLEFFRSHELVNEDGDTLDMEDVVNASSSNPAHRRNEMMACVKGLELIAEMRGDCAVFYTITCPSRFHSTLNNGRPNPTWTNATVRQSSDYMVGMFAAFRKAMHKTGLRWYGVRVAEPHHDGTVHWHLMCFMRKKDRRAITALLRKFAIRVDREELGNNTGPRFKSELINPRKGTPTSYIAKYISKNIDGRGLAGEISKETGKSLRDNAEYVNAWASLHRVQQFRFFGIPGRQAYRELRLLAGQAARQQGDKKAGAITSVKNGNLLFIRQGQGKSASGKPLPVITITRKDGDSHRFTLADRGAYTGVIASWLHTREPAKKESTTVKRKRRTKKQKKEPEAKQGDYLVGTDENVLVLNRTYANRSNAERAAKMQWERLQRGVASFSLQLAEGRADLYTEMPVKVSGFKQPIDDAEWTITTLTHTVSPDNGFTTSLELEVRIDDFEME
ncbi:TPA: replication endonuclease [Escherichia coli]|nr:replication endonuclease [Escherichia coli]